MAKATGHSVPETKNAPQAETVSGPGNQAAPKKTRKKGIKYTKLADSAYSPVDDKPPTNPLDQLAIAVRGGLKFPGIEFENNLLGLVVKIPALEKFIPAPTVRQLFEALDGFYKPKA